MKDLPEIKYVDGKEILIKLFEKFKILPISYLEELVYYTTLSDIENFTLEQILDKIKYAGEPVYHSDGLSVIDSHWGACGAFNLLCKLREEGKIIRQNDFYVKVYP